MDIWVPIVAPGSKLILQFGGGLALNAELHQWVFYSRNFAFSSGQVRREGGSWV